MATSQNQINDPNTNSKYVEFDLAENSHGDTVIMNGTSYLVDLWMYQAFKSLETRLETTAKGASEHNELWWKDPTDASREDLEDFDTHPIRKPEAASVNGLLNLATLPPLGYGGDLKKLADGNNVSMADKMAIALCEDANTKKNNSWQAGANRRP